MEMDEVVEKVQLDPKLCTRCGACLAVCPTYRASGRETESPRGRLALAWAWSEGRMSPAERTAELVYRCALCAACNIACPGGLAIDEILLGLRASLVGEELLPEPLQRLAGAVGEQHNILGENQVARTLWGEADGLMQGTAGSAEIVYFVGCVSALFPSSYALPRETIRLLQAARYNYALLGGDEWCCGYPLLLNGQEPAVAETAARLVAQVQALGARAVVTSCPSCYHTLRHVYPQFVPEMPFEVLHASELLLRAVQEGRLQLQALPETRVTYHDPCDLGRRSGLYDPPRALLRSVPGLELVEMRDRRENAVCCGGGGNLETVDPSLVEEAARRRLHQALDTGATVIATACPQCRRTLAGAARRERARLRVWDLAEVLGKVVPA